MMHHRCARRIKWTHANDGTTPSVAEDHQNHSNALDIFDNFPSIYQSSECWKGRRLQTRSVIWLRKYRGSLKNQIDDVKCCGLKQSDNGPKTQSHQVTNLIWSRPINNWSEVTSHVLTRLINFDYLNVPRNTLITSRGVDKLAFIYSYPHQYKAINGINDSGTEQRFTV